MNPSKFYLWSQDRPLRESDGCSYDEWMSGKGEAGFGRDADNIYLFLKPRQIEDFDKYVSGVFDIDLNTESPFHRMRKDATLTLLEAYQRSGAQLHRLLDVGCGLGHIMGGIGERYPQLEITGLEISLAATRRAAERMPQYDFVLADAHDLPFTHGYFQVILLNNVIEHVESPALLFKHLAPFLAPGGCIILSTPSRYRFENLVNVLTGKRASLMSSDHVLEYSVGQVKSLLEYSGYDVKRVLGPKRKPKQWTVRNMISHHLIKPLLYAGAAVVGSEHVIDSTAFYLATKRDS